MEASDGLGEKRSVPKSQARAAPCRPPPNPEKKSRRDRVERRLSKTFCFEVAVGFSAINNTFQFAGTTPSQGPQPIYKKSAELNTDWHNPARPNHRAVGYLGSSCLVSSSCQAT